MRKLAVMVLAMTFLGVAPGQSLEKIRTGGALLKNCEQFDVVARSRDALESALACWAYLQGATDTLWMLSNGGLLPKLCLPPQGLRNDDVRRLYLGWARDNPDKLDLAPSSAVPSPSWPPFPAPDSGPRAAQI